MTIATIGYEGASLDDFIATLRAAKIRTLVDVRELAISRRRGFAKNALSVALADADIAYVHLKGLGDPKEGRLAARAKDYGGFLRIYTKHMKTRVALDDLEKAVGLCRKGGVCLMCYERDPNECHRRLVADKVSAIIDSPIKHLGVKDGFAHADRQAHGTGHRTRQGSAARGQEAR